ncbi:manganese efflux pump MntP family protein [Halomonas sp. G15]|uniref:Putative manganese efflux pump MntP n=1 Tax=Halomonas ventosae TaxID=229007 RepID=A0A4R6H7W4_9GAMM|nr:MULTISPECIES: manganese efflux pump MntP family protein [Halomonas]MBF7053851.1 manganese efflux pump [Halomonas sp. KAO]MCE0733981.1 manganese efflux pump MntP family protein [Halomonas sp. G15]TDO04340.1 putative Mn2+ efflux pump MntP [Halomonas ventosae]
MNPFSLVMLAIAMSTDAFAAAVGKGSSLDKPHITEALRMGMIFGIVEATTPVIGWLVGQAASQFIENWDHWIAFTLLLILGLYMMYNGFKVPEEEAEKTKQHSLLLLMVTAIATSIDALAVGVSLAFIEINILVASLAIGLATMTMVTVGVLLGRAIGTLVGRWAEIVGGTVLVFVGAIVLYEHLA